MKKVIILVSALLVFTGICIKANAVFVLESGKDYNMVTKEIVNEDGTKTTIQEPEIIKPFPDKVTTHETILKENPPVKKTTHAKGFEKKLGLYVPTQPMFTVTTKKPQNWPMPDNPSAVARVSKSEKSKDKPVSYSWLITTVSLGIIAFAAFRLYLHFNEEPDPNRA